MTVPLRFLTNELSFENEDACREFIQSAVDPQNLFEAKLDDQGRGHIRVKVKEAANVFEQLRASAFRKVDIKGQL